MQVAISIIVHTSVYKIPGQAQTSQKLHPLVGLVNFFIELDCLAFSIGVYNAGGCLYRSGSLWVNLPEHMYEALVQWLPHNCIR